MYSCLRVCIVSVCVSVRPTFHTAINYLANINISVSLAYIEVLVTLALVKWQYTDCIWHFHLRCKWWRLIYQLHHQSCLASKSNAATQDFHPYSYGLPVRACSSRRTGLFLTRRSARFLLNQSGCGCCAASININSNPSIFRKCYEGRLDFDSSRR